MSPSSTSTARWDRHDYDTRALDELLDAAGVAFAHHGVARATMSDIARAAGCARSTVYRYFPDRSALRVAYLTRAATRIAAGVVSAHPDRGDPVATLVDRIMSAVATIRADDVLSSLFTPDNIAIPLAASRRSAHIDAIAAGANRPTRSALDIDPAVKRWGQWLIRTALSLLAMPMANVAEERLWLEEVMAPALVAALPDHDRSSPRPIRET